VTAPFGIELHFSSPRSHASRGIVIMGRDFIVHVTLYIGITFVNYNDYIPIKPRWDACQLNKQCLRKPRPCIINEADFGRIGIKTNRLNSGANKYTSDLHGHL